MTYDSRDRHEVNNSSVNEITKVRDLHLINSKQLVPSTIY